MHVLHVNCVQDPLGRIGRPLLDAWPTLGSVAAAVAGAGARVTVLQSARENASLEQSAVSFRFVAEPGIRRRNWSGLLPGRLATVARSLAPDVIHLNGTFFPFHTRALSQTGAPLLVQHHAGGPRHGVRGLLQRWGLAGADGIAFTAVEQALPFRAVLSPRTRIFAIPESSTVFKPGSRDEARAATGIDGNPALLWVGRLDDNKDPLTILSAVSLAMTQLPDLKLWCCFHEAPLLGCVKARLAGAPELARRTHLIGLVPHAKMELLYRAADLFVLGSHEEGSGYALIEALACGTTPVVSDIPSFRALTGGAVGALAAPGDAAGFAKAIVSLAQQPGPELRSRTVAHFKSHLSFTVVGQKLVETYRALIDSSRTAR